MKPWKRTLETWMTALDTLLQWGHGDEAVEESWLPRDYVVKSHASMGPRR